MPARRSAARVAGWVTLAAVLVASAGWYVAWRQQGAAARAAFAEYRALADEAADRVGAYWAAVKDDPGGPRAAAARAEMEAVLARRIALEERWSDDWLRMGLRGRRPAVKGSVGGEG